MTVRGVLRRVDSVPSILTRWPVATPSSDVTLRVPAPAKPATTSSNAATIRLLSRTALLDAHDRLAQQEASGLVVELELRVLADQPRENVEVPAGAMHVAGRARARGVVGDQERSEIVDVDRRIIESFV